MTLATTTTTAGARSNASAITSSVCKRLGYSVDVTEV